MATKKNPLIKGYVSIDGEMAGDLAPIPNDDLMRPVAKRENRHKIANLEVVQKLSPKHLSTPW